ncbi:Formate hydrogenlyase transcriptional activator [Gemmata obscuriglobus]|uniref:PAS domain S-box protein n=1 Tax=Gemmata obscuriglobus TaxID=114 RepID=A0A2Z3HF84_9BACT|nr:sigma 54-interacting transcriptional regulator [Gemmata obscuriglobus]AWM40434.1 PAS domain S-box protein [Gemmata obscuriglobus]QEG26327.1 Formate hydrogenlyase transcriptional activator [Gemmata obscuriglobus]VTS01270.1 fis family transcriptional regulator : Formate hydrogenlyase transcriptional activator OS=Methyloglobulus morosus KoM1 GN=fhlA PE=4 SV=1: GAF: PAS_9: Sigma54_activat: HTH_8 [Gemmata obscuriglobus UQM 2246]
MPELNQPADREEVAALRAIVEGTARHTGEEFFRSLVRNLSAATGVPNAFVAEFAEQRTRIRSLAFWQDGAFLPPDEWELAGTPCEDVLAGSFCHHPTGVSEKFPKDAGVESYLGVPLRDASGAVLGHLAVFDARPMPPEPRLLYTFQIFAARAAAELDRLRMDRMLRDSEERFRDLFEEAPVAYVHEDMESRFIRANRTALRVLGLKPEEAVGTVGMSLVPDTPDAQRLVKEAFASIGRGTDTGGVVLELRRKDDGRPIWIQWWSRPDRGGQFTRTVFIDVTERVLMEREQARLQQQNVYLQEELKAAHNFDEIVGQSPALVSVLQRVSKVAGTDSTVLITGETGTGKELVARAVHSASPRKAKPLIKLNCAALPTHLVESELFGHEKGAFTGAVARKPGRFELADGGTLFLDEVGELSLEAQAKLLRVLQEREFERVGGTAPVKVDVRVIAATNRDLAQLVKEGAFRADLLYRLNVFPVRLPALRERPGDIPLLVRFFVTKFAGRLGKRIERVSGDTLDALVGYDWPGNIRELENVIERAAILSDGPELVIDPDVLPVTRGGAAPAGAGGQSLVAVEADHIRSVLAQTGWVIEGPNGAATVLGLHPNTLRSRMKKLGILRPS